MTPTRRCAGKRSRYPRLLSAREWGHVNTHFLLISHACFLRSFVLDIFLCAQFESQRRELVRQLEKKDAEIEEQKQQLAAEFDNVRAVQHGCCDLLLISLDSFLSS